MNIRHLLLGTAAAALLSSCVSKKEDGPVTMGKDKNSVQVVTYMPVGDLADPEHGKQTFFSYGAVVGAGSVKANGVASVLVFEDKTSVAGLQVNVALPAEGTFYEAWIYASNAPESSWKSLGHLQSVVGDVRHALKSESAESLQNMTQIAVTLEQDDGNPSPSGQVVATALLKQAKR